ncbi:MAG: DUF503 domain-containing protein [Acidimicrobiia bacterium]
MHAAALRVELRIPDVHSLKEKRHRMSILTTDLRKAFPAAALAEVDHQDQWQRASLGAALVAADAGQLQRLIAGIKRYFDRRPDAELLEVAVSYLEGQ